MRAGRGRHSSENDGVFLRSLAVAAVKWVALLAFPLLAGWGIWQLVDSGERRPAAGGAPAASNPPAAANAAASPAGEPTAVPGEPTPSSPAPTEPPSPAAPSGKLQVLQATPSQGLATTAARRLRDAGYEVIAVRRAIRYYDATTVFYHPGYEELAAAVAQVVGAGVVERAPANLSSDAAVTVAIGSDFKG